MYKILLAEDDEHLGFMLKDNLQELGYTVLWCKNGMEALSLLSDVDIDLCLLDVMMPIMGGFELSEKIRDVRMQLPIVFLTARSLEEDKLMGFQLGADDYVTKPFSIKELDSRIRAILKRSGTNTPVPDTLVFGASTLHLTNMTYACQSKTIFLTDLEAKLLTLLVMHRNKLVKRETILESIWGENDYFKGRSLDVFISRLRKYLSIDNTLKIKNHHGVGFTLKTP